MPRRSARRSITVPDERQPHDVLDLGKRQERRAMPVAPGRPTDRQPLVADLPRRPTAD